MSASISLSNYYQLSDENKDLYLQLLLEENNVIFSFGKAKRKEIEPLLNAAKKKMFQYAFISGKKQLGKPFLKNILDDLGEGSLEELNAKLLSSLFSSQLASDLKNGSFDEEQMILFLEDQRPQKRKLCDKFLLLEGISIDISEARKESIKLKKEAEDSKRARDDIQAKYEELRQLYDKAVEDNKRLKGGVKSDPEYIKLENKYESSESTLQRIRKELADAKEENKKVIAENETLKQTAQNGALPLQTENADHINDGLDDRVLDDLQDRVLMGVVNRIRLRDGFLVVHPISSIFGDVSIDLREKLETVIDYRGDFSSSLLFLRNTSQTNLFLPEGIGSIFSSLSDDVRYEYLREAFKDKVFFYRIELATPKNGDKMKLNAVLCSKPQEITQVFANFNSKKVFIPRYRGSEKEFLELLKNKENLRFENYPTTLFSSLSYVVVDKKVYKVSYGRRLGGSDDSYTWEYRPDDSLPPYKLVKSNINSGNKDWYYTLPADDEGFSGGIYADLNTLNDDSNSDLDEPKFISDVNRNAQSASLYFEEDDIKLFHIAMKSSPLVILAGPNGIGKTQLPLVYAETLGLSEERGTLLFVPISPSFLEPEDVLGYVRPCTDKQYGGEFIESQTGLVSFLKEAEEMKDKIFMIVFDEMNLSQIEHWFAPFMSLLERNEKSRTLRLYAEGLTVKNDDMYPSSITIGDNVFFVGTINIDETTKQISDRLMDRAIIMNLSAPSFEKLCDMEPSSPSTYKEISFSSFGAVVKNVDNAAKVFKEKEPEAFALLDEMNRCMLDSPYHKGISFRSLKKLALFFDNSSGLLRPELALDYGIAEIVVKKISGTFDELGSILQEDGGLLAIINNHPKVGPLTRTVKSIKQKIAELSNYGFTR